MTHPLCPSAGVKSTRHHTCLRTSIFCTDFTFSGRPILTTLLKTRSQRWMAGSRARALAALLEANLYSITHIRWLTLPVTPSVGNPTPPFGFGASKYTCTHTHTLIRTHTYSNTDRQILKLLDLSQCLLHSEFFS